MSTLFQIADDALALQQLIDEQGEELTPEVAEALDAWFAQVGEDQAKKTENYCYLIRHYELQAAAALAELDRLKKLHQARANAAKRLKERLFVHMQLTNQKRISTDRFEVSVRGNGGMVPLEVPDPMILPSEFQRVIFEADNDKIREALQAGQTVRGASLKERGKHLEIH